MNKISILLALLFGGFQLMFGQIDQKSPFAISGYAEVYYQQDFSNPTKNDRPSFIYSHNRNNEFNLNLVFIKGGVLWESADY